MSAKVEPDDAEDPAPPPAAEPAWNATKKPGPMSHEECSLFHKQCKALSYAHHLIFRPAPAKFICCFLDKDFAAICDQHQDSEKVKWAKSILTLVILLFLPMGYGHAVMSYPCAPVVRQVQTVSDQNPTVSPSTHQEFRALQCTTEDFLRSWESMYLGLAAFVVSFALWIFNLCMAGGCCCGLRGLGTYLYTLQTSYVRPHLCELTIQPSRGPGSYEWPMCVYSAFLLEMLGVCVMLQSGMAILIGIVAGNLFLMICNWIYAIYPIFGAMVKGELAAVPILDRLFHSGLLQSTHASIAELACLWDGAKFNGECRMNEVVEQDCFPMALGAMLRMHDPNPKWRQPFSRIPIFLTEVYIPDRNATVNLITGVIECQGKPVWSEATGLVATSGGDKKIP